MSSRTQGIIWWVIAVAMGWWAYQDFALMKVVLSILALTLGSLLLVKHKLIQRQMSLTQEELEAYHTQLVEATGEIIRLSEARMKVSEIAEKMERSFGLPREVTLKYIIALGRYQEQHQG